MSGTYSVVSTGRWHGYAGCTGGYASCWWGDLPRGRYAEINIVGYGVTSWLPSYSCASPCASYNDVKAAMDSLPMGTTYEVQNQANTQVALFRYLPDAAIPGLTVRSAPYVCTGSCLSSVTGTIDSSTFNGNETQPATFSTAPFPAMRSAIEAGSLPSQVIIAKGIDQDYDGPGFTMPDCYGLTVSTCEATVNAAADAGAAAHPSYSVSAASDDYSDLWLSAGSALSTSPDAQTIGAPSAVTITDNPDPLPTAGGDHAGDSGGDGAGTTATGNGDQCDFFAEQSAKFDPPLTWTAALDLNQTFYEGACQDAWDSFWSQLGVSPGDLPQAVIDSAKVMRGGDWMSTVLGNESVIEELTTGGRSLSDWEKVTTGYYTSEGGLEFQVHFYRYVGEEPWEANVVKDFKIRFRRIFLPPS